MNNKGMEGNFAEDSTNANGSYVNKKEKKAKDEFRSKEPLDIFDLGFAEQKAKITRKNLILMFVGFCVFGLYLSAVIFAFMALAALSRYSILPAGLILVPYRLNTTPHLDWHVLLVVSSFLIPPTILLFITIKGVFNMSIKESDTPAQEIIQNGKEMVESTIDTADAAGGFFSNLFGKLTGK